MKQNIGGKEMKNGKLEGEIMRSQRRQSFQVKKNLWKSRGREREREREKEREREMEKTSPHWHKLGGEAHTSRCSFPSFFQFCTFHSV